MGDVDDDEVVYGGCCIDHNGKGLWNPGTGCRDALHLNHEKRTANLVLLLRLVLLK